MIVSNSRRFVFFHNPKAAGTSFRTSIQEYHDFGRSFWGEEFSPYFGTKIDLAHLRAWELPCVAPNLYDDLRSYRTLVFVRNPAKRFISSCIEYYRKFHPGVGFERQDVDTQRSLIRRLIETQLSPSNVLSDFQFVHFSLQRWFAFLGPRRLADHILPLRSEIEDFASAYDILEIPRRPLRREHHSRPDSFEKLICPEFSDFVSRFYAADYDMIASLEHLRPLLEIS